MAISKFPGSSVQNILPPTQLLHFWQEYNYENVWRFNQVTGDDVILNRYEVYVQDDREEIATGLTQAYQMMLSRLRFPLVNQWITERIQLGHAEPSAFQPLNLTYGQINEIGVRTKTLIESGAAIVYSQSQAALTQDDTATITLVGTGTIDPDEVHIYYPGQSANDIYEILPITVTYSAAAGGTLTITAHRANFVDLDIINRPYEWANPTDKNAALTSNAGDFITTVDVYRVYADATSAVTFGYDPIYCQCTDLDTSLTDAGVARIVDAELGTVQVRRECCTTSNSCGCYYPQFVDISYSAGYGNNLLLLQALVHYANTFIPETLCPENDRGKNRFVYDNAQSVVSPSLVNNPFGTLNGQLDTWRLVENAALPTAAKMTRQTRW